MRIKPGQRPQRAREPRSSRGQSLGARRVLEANAARHDFKHAVAFELGEGTADRFDGQPQEVRYALLSRWCSSHVDLASKTENAPDGPPLAQANGDSAGAGKIEAGWCNEWPGHFRPNGSQVIGRFPFVPRPAAYGD